MDCDWNPKARILNTFLKFSVFVMQISYFRVKKLKKPLLRAKCFFLERDRSVSKNPEFYTDFRSEKFIQKKITKKVDPKTTFWGLEPIF